MIIRSHECVMDGFDKFGNGSLITVFSCTDYCGKYQNAAAVLYIRKNCEMVPKVIYPNQGLSGGISHHNTEDESSKKVPFKGMGFGGLTIGHTTVSQNSTWMDNDDTLKKRPATPPRITNSKSMKK